MSEQRLFTHDQTAGMFTLLFKILLLITLFILEYLLVLKGKHIDVGLSMQRSKLGFLVNS